MDIGDKIFALVVTWTVIVPAVIYSLINLSDASKSFLVRQHKQDCNGDQDSNEKPSSNKN